MSKLSSSERFFIDLIALGMESKGSSITQEDIQMLLGSSLKYDKVFMNRCVTALDTVYSNPSFPKGLIEDQIKKLYSGRDTLLQETVMQWYRNVINPTLFQRLRKLVK